MRQKKIRKHGLLLDAPLDDPARCRDCGGICCRSFESVGLTWEEYRLLKDLGGTRLEFSLNGHYRLVIEHGCEFLDGGRCTIYDSRPEICRRFYCED